MRLASYRKRQRDFAYELCRVDRSAREAEAKVWKAIWKANRGFRSEDPADNAG
jgi:hypothetical protein